MPLLFSLLRELASGGRYGGACAGRQMPSSTWGQAPCLSSTTRAFGWRRLVPLLFALLGEGPPALAGAAADVLAAMLGKRMEAGAKLALVQQLGIVPLLARWAGGLPGSSGGSGGANGSGGAGVGGGEEEDGEDKVEEGEGADELEVKCAQLLATLATGAPGWGLFLYRG